MKGMQLFKTIFGTILFVAFISFLGWKFYKAVEHMEAANLIMWLACVIVLLLVFVIRRVLTY